MKLRVPGILWCSLLTLVVVVVAVAIEVAIPAWRQGAVLATTRRLGGYYQATPRGPEWLRRQLGDDWQGLLDDVHEVFVVRTDECHDADIAQICWLPHLTAIGVGGRGITDSGLSMISRKDLLQAVTLERASITDSGLQELAKLPCLRALTIRQVAVTDGSVETIKKLHRLEYLRLYETGVTDAGIAELQRALPGLKIER